MGRISNLLTSFDLEHVIFKSIRPYPDESVDIDTIVFSWDQYQEAAKLLPKHGYPIDGVGPESITYFDPKAEVGIDLYRDVAVSCFIYLDKMKLRKYVTSMILPNEKQVCTFQLEADIIAIIAHSVIKEQMYTLAEYFTFLGHLDKMNNRQLESLLSLSKTNNIETAVRAFITITKRLCKEAYGNIPSKLEFLSNALGMDVLEERKLMDEKLRTPHRYHILTILKSITGKLHEKKTRVSVKSQALSMLQPRFTKDAIERISTHLTRETY